MNPANLWLQGQIGEYCLYNLLQASTGMSSLWWHVGKGLGSIPVEAVLKVLLLETPPIDSLPSHLPP